MRLTSDQKNEIYEKEARKRVAIIKQAICCEHVFNGFIAGSGLATTTYLYALKMVENKTDCLVTTGLTALLGVIGIGGRLYASRKAEKGKKAVAELMSDWKEDKYDQSAVWANMDEYSEYTESYVVGEHNRFDPYVHMEEQEPTR